MAKDPKSKDAEQQQTSREGPRSFGFFLQKVASGDAEAELSRELHKLIVAVKDEARVRESKIKGALTLKLSFEVDGKDDVPVVNVNFEVATKPPKPARRKGYFWITEGGNLTSEAPKQENLPLDVIGGRRAPLDVGDDDRPVRGL